MCNVYYCTCSVKPLYVLATTFFRKTQGAYMINMYCYELNLRNFEIGLANNVSPRHNLRSYFSSNKLDIAFRIPGKMVTFSP